MPEYQIDLDLVHAVLRLTVTAETVTMEMAKDLHVQLTRIASSGGPYAAIYDLTCVKHTPIPTHEVRNMARGPRSVPAGRKQVIVGEAPAIFGLARLFQVCGENVGSEFEVVHSLKEAYEIVGVRPEDFTQRLVNSDNFGDNRGYLGEGHET